MQRGLCEAPRSFSKLLHRRGFTKLQYRGGFWKPLYTVLVLSGQLPFMSIFIFKSYISCLFCCQPVKRSTWQLLRLFVLSQRNMAATGFVLFIWLVLISALRNTCSQLLWVPVKEGKMAASSYRYNTFEITLSQFILVFISKFLKKKCMFWVPVNGEEGTVYSILYLYVQELATKEGKNGRVHIWLDSY